MKFIQELNERLLQLIDCYSEIVLEKDGFISKNTPYDLCKDRIKLKTHAIFIEMFAQKRENIIEGCQTEAGNVGWNGLAIRQAIIEGNLREKMYFPYKCSWSFLRILFNDLDLVDELNQRLIEKGMGWQLEVDKIKEWRDSTFYGAFAYSMYANKSRADGLKIINSSEEVARRVAKNPTAHDLSRIPLSTREKRHLAAECDPTRTAMSDGLSSHFGSAMQQPLPWLSGSVLFQVATNKKRAVPDPYLTAMEANFFPVGSVIAGSLDLLFTLAIYLGFTRKEDLERARLASIGWLIDNQDHSLHEVMVAAMGFGLPHTLSPTSYQKIYPADSSFVDQVRTAQLSRHSDLPEKFLSTEWFHLRWKEVVNKQK